MRKVNSVTNLWVDGLLIAIMGAIIGVIAHWYLGTNGPLGAFLCTAAISFPLAAGGILKW